MSFSGKVTNHLASCLFHSSQTLLFFFCSWLTGIIIIIIIPFLSLYNNRPPNRHRYSVAHHSRCCCRSSLTADFPILMITSFFLLFWLRINFPHPSFFVPLTFYTLSRSSFFIHIPFPILPSIFNSYTSYFSFSIPISLQTCYHYYYKQCSLIFAENAFIVYYQLYLFRTNGCRFSFVFISISRSIPTHPLKHFIIFLTYIAISSSLDNTTDTKTCQFFNRRIQKELPKLSPESKK